MGYHLGETVIIRAQKYLEELLNTKERTVVIKTQNARATAHLIREALHVSRKVEGKYKDLRFTIKEGLDCIICVKKTDTEESLVEIIRDQGFPLPTVKRIEEVIGACLEHAGKVLLFPNYQPSGDELIVLERWGAIQNIKFHYNDNKLTARPC